jgi:hypothetical protein
MTALPAYLTNCEQQTIDLSNGAVEYVWVDITDAQKQDITAAVVSVALGGYDTPGTWHPASPVQQNGAVYKIRAGLLIGSGLTYPAGTYWVHWKLVDSPETLIGRADNILVTIT